MIRLIASDMDGTLLDENGEADSAEEHHAR